jgi:hypothetical protein
LPNGPVSVTHLIMADDAMSLATEGEPRASLPPPAALADIPAGTPCWNCHRAIDAEYFVANGHVLCGACCARLQGGSTAAALAFGVAAAVATAGLHYLISVMFHANFVLSGVLAGVLVGLGVRRGAQGNRAQGYRWLALSLTYLTVVSTYVAPLFAMPDVSTMLGAALHALYLPGLMLLTMKNPVSLIMLGIGLHEAWKLSAPHVLNVDGPFPTKAVRAEASA